MTEMFKDTRSEKKRNDLKKEKWDRSIRLNHGQEAMVASKPSTNNVRSDAKTYSDADTNSENSQDESQSLLNRINLIANPTNFQRRARSESPPPKSKRSNDGINRGKPSACSHCRPAIHTRMYDTSIVRSEIRSEIRTYNSTDPLIDHQPDLAE
jgi:hypothetical protein